MCLFVRVKCKEDEVMSKIRDAEHSQLVEEMRRRVAELEIEVIIIITVLVTGRYCNSPSAHLMLQPSRRSSL